MASEASTRAAGPTDLTVKIVSAYLLKNRASPAEMLNLIRTVYAALASFEAGRDRSREKADLRRVQDSITPNALISFVDGKPYKSLKRHLTSLGFDPQSYRERYLLPDEYPMVASRYAARRSQIARASGLGRRKKSTTPSK